MLNFNKLMPGKLYRTKAQYSLPYDPKKITKGTLLSVFGENTDDTVDFFKRPEFKFNRYSRYFVDKKMKVTIMKRKIIKREDQQEIFDDGFGKYFNTRLCRTVSNVNNFNVIYELNNYSELLYEDERVEGRGIYQQAEIKFDYVMNILKETSQRFPDHKKYLFLPIDKYVPFPKNSTFWTNRQYLNNNLMVFLRHIGTEHNRFKELKDWSLVFVNVNELFYLDCKDFTSDTYDIVRKLFKKFKSKAGYADKTECDDDDINLSEGDISEEADSTILSHNEDVTSQVVKTAKDAAKDSIVGDQIVEKVKDRMASLYDTNKAKTLIKVDKIETPKEEKTTGSKRLSTIKIRTGESQVISDNPNPTGNMDISDTKDNFTDSKIIPKSEAKEVAERTIKSEINKLVAPPMSASRLARVTKIQKEQEKLSLDNKPISTVIKEAESKIIDDHNIKADLINKKMNNIKFDNFEKGYNDKLLNYDLINILKSFSEKDRPLYLIDLKKEDTSTSLDKMYTVTATYEDERGTRHILTFDMPKFVNNKFIHMNGSDKLFINQILPLPVTKVSPEEVQVSSNYNKVFIKRFGKVVSAKIDKFHKALPDVKSSIVRFTKGNNVTANSQYMTTMEYDELSSKYNTIEIVNRGITIYFNQDEIRRIVDDKYDDTKVIPCGTQITENGDTKIIFLDAINDAVIGENGLSLIDFIVENISEDYPEFRNDFIKSSSSKRMVYTRATIMAKKVPIVLLLGFLDGLEPLLNRLKVNYEFTTTRPILKGKSVEKGVIQFKDGYLVYDFYPFANSLILNGLVDIPTEEYEFLEFSDKDIYYDIFQKMFGRRNIGVAFENFDQLFIDPITKEILKDMNLPTNFIDLIIYANSLLENNAYDLDGDLKNYRVRTNELVNAHLYKLLSKAYENYRVSADNRTPTKFNIKRDDLKKDMMSSQIMEEYSTLNPIYEIDRMRATSFKGPGGCNVDNAFSIAKRAYNDTMVGVLAQSSPVSANVGISRILSLNPNIKSLRGYIEPGDPKKLKDVDATKMLSGAELLLPMTATHDDSQRISMASTQSRHTIATMDSDTPLFGYGMDKVLPKVISDRFAFKAKEDGEIIEVNEKLGYMAVRYKSGKTDIVDLTNRQALNTGSGFYVTNTLKQNTSEVGTKFKAGDVIASNNEFFKHDKISNETIYKSGPLARVALIHGSAVFEDSTIVTERLAERLSSKITEKKEVCIGKNSNIYSMVNIGDKVRTGDPLIIFDESYTDDYLNKILEKMNESDKDDLIDAGRTPVKSKHNGEIIDIKIYYCVDKSELSPSMQNIINKYEDIMKKRMKRFKDLGVDSKELLSLNETSAYVEPINGKVKGIKMGDNAVLIEFYIQTVDKFSVGDKITYSVALKGINHGLIPKGQEPYIGSDPNEKIDAFMSVSGYYSRMTNSFVLGLMLNTILLGAEKKIADILK